MGTGRIERPKSPDGLQSALREYLGDEDYNNFTAISNWTWAGPIKIHELMDSGIGGGAIWPHEFEGVYMVSARSWDRKPDETCRPLYVGSTGVLRKRVGDLIADTLGFFIEKNGRMLAVHSAGGQSLYRYCRAEKLLPRTLYIGWIENCSCLRCAEDFAIYWLEPSLNKINSPKCKEHHGDHRYLAAFKNKNMKQDI